MTRVLPDAVVAYKPLSTLRMRAMPPLHYLCVLSKVPPTLWKRRLGLVYTNSSARPCLAVITTVAVTARAINQGRPRRPLPRSTKISLPFGMTLVLTTTER